MVTPSPKPFLPLRLQLPSLPVLPIGKRLAQLSDQSKREPLLWPRKPVSSPASKFWQTWVRSCARVTALLPCGKPASQANCKCFETSRRCINLPVTKEKDAFILSVVHEWKITIKAHLGLLPRLLHCDQNTWVLCICPMCNRTLSVV